MVQVADSLGSELSLKCFDDDLIVEMFTRKQWEVQSVRFGAVGRNERPPCLFQWCSGVDIVSGLDTASNAFLMVAS